MAKRVQINKEYVQKYVEEKGYPEVGTFEDKKDLQRFYKHLSMEQLHDWLELEGLTYTPCESEAINRMRACMAILYKHFPKAPAKKKRSKYADYTLEQLINMAIEHEVPVEPTHDERILRMRTIMALRAAGHLE